MVTPEVGKKYLNTFGETVAMVDKNDDERYPFWGNDGNSYTAKGTEFINKPSPNDLVSEVVEKKEGETMREVKHGETWVDHNGKEHRIEARDHNAMCINEYPIQDQDGDWYTEDGFHCIDGSFSKLDLVALKSEPKVLENKQVNPFLESMFEEVPATRKFVGIDTHFFSIKESTKEETVYLIEETVFIELPYKHLNLRNIKKLILALEATVTHLEKK